MEQHPFDPLTGFGTREALLEALTRAVDPGRAPTLLVIFRLEGFDDYVDLNGTADGQELLARLAARLAEALPSGSCFRPRYDEFCVLVEATIADARPVFDRSARALRERSAAVAVSASWGAAMLPEEASTPIGALKLADDRLASNAPPRRRKSRRLGERRRV